MLITEAQAKPLVIGIEANNHPPLYWKEGDKYHGLYPELLDDFANEYGHSIVYRSYPVKGLFQALVDKEIDFKFPDKVTWMPVLKKDKKIHYSAPIFQLVEGVMVKPNNLSKEIKLLSSINVSDMSHLFDINKVTKIHSPSLETAVLLALKSRTDGVYANIQSVQHILKTQLNQLDSLVFDDSQPHSVRRYYMSTIQHSKILLQFNQYVIDNNEQVKLVKPEYNTQYGKR